LSPLVEEERLDDLRREELRRHDLDLNRLKPTASNYSREERTGLKPHVNRGPRWERKKKGANRFNTEDDYGSNAWGKQEAHDIVA